MTSAPDTSAAAFTQFAGTYRRHSHYAPGRDRGRSASILERMCLRQETKKAAYQSVCPN
jgi:hypothetical protein